MTANRELQPGQDIECVGSEPTWSSVKRSQMMFEFIVDTCIGVVLIVSVFAGLMVGYLIL